jgi:precorrin-2 dehydrogenase / sirohydrochlorin ferrochelatase
VTAPAYPVNLRVEGRTVLLVGGGAVALEKLEELAAAGAVVTVVAPEVRDDVAALSAEVRRRPFRPGDTAGFRLVVVATGDPDVADAVFAEAEAAGIWVNSADDPARCTFTLPARLRRGDLLVTVSTGGASPAFATWLRDEIGDWLEPSHLQLLDLLAAERRRMRAEGRPSMHPGWQQALRSGMLERLRDGDVPGAEELLRSCLSSPSA